MRLLVIAAAYPPHQVGGYEIRCKDVIDGLLRRGHDALILTTHCPNKKCNLHKDETNIERRLHQKEESKNLIKQIVNDIKDMSLINKEVKEFNPDIIYLWGIQNLSNAILPFFSNQTKTIVFDEGGSSLIYLRKIYARGLYFYGNKGSAVKNLLKKMIYSFSKILSFGLINPEWTWPGGMNVYFNSFSALNYSKDSGVPTENAQVIYSGIEIDRFPFYDRTQIKKLVTIIVPGRIKLVKGTQDAVKLVRELRNRNLDVKLMIIGKIQSEEYFKDLNKEIIDYGLKGAISYYPMVTQNELVRYYQQSDICFSPTYKKDGLSRVPIEAMATGCVVVTYGNEGSNEIIQNGYTGFIVAEGDTNAAAEVIENLIKNPGLYRQILLNARENIEKNHSLDNYIDEIEKYLHERLLN